MALQDRPLSPFLIYRWQISNALSIVHRLTGVLLSSGAVVLTLWLAAIAAGRDAYELMLSLLRSPIGLLLLFGWSFCFFYHLANGIRHLAWDAGYGFEKQRARSTGIAVVIAAVALTAAFWAVALMRTGIPL